MCHWIFFCYLSTIIFWKYPLAYLSASLFLFIFNFILIPKGLFVCDCSQLAINIKRKCYVKSYKNSQYFNHFWATESASLCSLPYDIGDTHGQRLTEMLLIPESLLHNRSSIWTSASSVGFYGAGSIWRPSFDQLRVQYSVFLYQLNEHLLHTYYGLGTTFSLGYKDECITVPTLQSMQSKTGDRQGRNYSAK